jgi:hypothetical protein
LNKDVALFNKVLSGKGGSTSSTLRIRFEWEFKRKPTMNELLHRKEDGAWDSERAERASVSFFFNFIAQL